MANVDIAVRAKDMATKVMKDVEGGSSKMGGAIKQHAAKAALAVAGIGIALEAAARKQAELTEKTRNLAASTGIADGKMRDLILSTSNVTFTLEDVQDTMIAAREQGLKSEKALVDYANYWDMVADATGGSAPELAKAGVALNALGIEAGKETKATEALGFVTRETTSTIDQFFSFVGRMGVYLREMGMDINDTAAVLGVLERELGMSGIVARREFAKAVQESDGDMNKMLETLGVTTEAFERYKLKVAESGSVLEDQAAVNEKTFTTMQKLQHWAKETMYRYGDLIGMMGSLAPLLIAAPILIKGMSLAWSGLKMVMAGVKAGFSFLTSLPTILSMVHQQGLKATLQAGKLWPAISKVGTKVAEMATSFGHKAIEGAQGVISGIGSASLGAAAQVAMVTAAFVALAAAILIILDQYKKLQKAWAQEKDALENEKTMMKKMYEVGGEKAVVDYLNKQKGSMNAGTAAILAQYLEDLRARGPGGTKPVKMAEGGIVTRPTFALIGEAGPEAVVPLRRGAGGSRKLEVFGTVRVEGVNDKGQLMAVIPVVIDELRREMRKS